MKKSINIAAIEAPATNILGLSNPNEFESRIYRYEPWALSIYIQSLNTEAQILRLIFGDVRYIACPVKWRGANLCVEDDKQYWNTLTTIGDVVNIEKPDPTSFQQSRVNFIPKPLGKLFTIPCDGFQVKILANTLTVVDEAD